MAGFLLDHGVDPEISSDDTAGFFVRIHGGGAAEEGNEALARFGSRGYRNRRGEQAR
jgi:hypothetical protein